MLKVALYFMVFFLLVSAIVIFIFAVNKGNKKKLNIINSAYLVISLINYMMFLGELIDTGWNLIIVTPVSVVSIILLITSLIISKARYCQRGETTDGVESSTELVESHVRSV